jgi:hypothetical protein
MLVAVGFIGMLGFRCRLLWSWKNADGGLVTRINGGVAPHALFRSWHATHGYEARLFLAAGDEPFVLLPFSK